MMMAYAAGSGDPGTAEARRELYLDYVDTGGVQPTLIEVLVGSEGNSRHASFKLRPNVTQEVSAIVDRDRCRFRGGSLQVLTAFLNGRESISEEGKSALPPMVSLGHQSRPLKQRKMIRHSLL
jgi:hypothetical protein